MIGRLLEPVRRRKRLELHSVVNPDIGLKRWHDPETDRYYLAPGRWHPIMVTSVITMMRDTIDDELIDELGNDE